MLLTSTHVKISLNLKLFLCVWLFSDRLQLCMKSHNPLNHRFEWGLIRQHSGGTAEQTKRSPGKKVTSGSTCTGTCCYIIHHEYMAGKLFYNMSSTFFYLNPGNSDERWKNYHDNWYHWLWVIHLDFFGFFPQSKDSKQMDLSLKIDTFGVHSRSHLYPGFTSLTYEHKLWL